MSFVSELGRINTILNNRNSEWTDIVKVLSTLQKLSATASDFAVRSQDITDLRCGLTLLIKDSRSKVVRETCETISIMATNLKNSFEPVSQMLFFDCLDKVSSSTNGTAFQKVCKDVVQNVVMRRFISTLLMYIEKRPEKTAQTAIECLEVVISKWPVNIINQHQAAIVDALCKAVNSYSPSVRSISKTIITTCKTLFPDMKRLFLLKLSLKDRCLVEDSVGSAALNTQSNAPSSRSFVLGGVSYQLNQTVRCHLSNGVYQGVIKYIGKPDGRAWRVGVAFSQYVGIKHTGVLNGVRLFECTPGYGAVVLPSQIQLVESPQRSRSVREVNQSLSVTAVSPAKSINSSFSQIAQTPKSTSYSTPSLSGKCSVEDCVAFHKLMIFNALQDFHSELQMLEDLESRKMDPKAIEAYRNDMEVIINKRQREESDFVTKLARVSV